MPTPARERLARLLASDTTPTSRHASLTAPASALSLTVEPVGRVSLPIRSAVATKIIATAEAAHVGRGEDTLLDR